MVGEFLRGCEVFLARPRFVWLQERRLQAGGGKNLEVSLTRAHGLGRARPDRLALRRDGKNSIKSWWAREDSNLQPDRYERSSLSRTK
jgi:hypothetical protein